MRTNEPINLMSFRSEAVRKTSGSVERQYRLSFGLVALLCAATVIAVMTLGVNSGQDGAQPLTAQKNIVFIDRG